MTLCFAATFAMSISANTNASETAEGPKISSQNILYSDKFSLMYAIDADTVADGTAVTLRVYDSIDENGNPAGKLLFEGTQTQAEVISAGAEPYGYSKNAYIFTTPGVALHNMAKNYYVQAEVDGVKGEVKRYSVAEYFYQKLSSETSATMSEEEIEKNNSFYKSALEFGASAEKYTGKAAPYVTELRYVTVENGTLDGFFNTGLYKAGTKLALSPSDSGTWTVSQYGEKGAQIGANEFGLTEVVVPETADMYKLAVQHVALKTGTVTFDDWTTLSGHGANVTDGTYEFTQVSGRGQVLDATLSKNSYIRFNQQYTGLTSEDATAHEVSFDLKFDTAVQNHGLFLRLYGLNGSSEAWAMGVSLYPAADGTAVLRVDESSSKQHSLTEIDLNGWNTIKFVIYKSEPLKCYFSINGGTEYELSPASFYTYGATTHIRMTGMSSTSNDGFLVDNFFSGYTTETKE